MTLDKRDESRDATNETREALRPSYKARLANGLELTTAMELERQRDCLRIALEDVELRTTQAQIASRIGKKTKERTDQFPCWTARSNRTVCSPNNNSQ
jgi:hypothetical protein